MSEALKRAKELLGDIADQDLEEWEKAGALFVDGGHPDFCPQDRNLKALVDEYESLVEKVKELEKGVGELEAEVQDKEKDASGERQKMVSPILRRAVRRVEEVYNGRLQGFDHEVLDAIDSEDT